MYYYHPKKKVLKLINKCNCKFKILIDTSLLVLGTASFPHHCRKSNVVSLNMNCWWVADALPPPLPGCCSWWESAASRRDLLGCFRRFSCCPVVVYWARIWHLWARSRSEKEYGRVTAETVAFLLCFAAAADGCGWADSAGIDHDWFAGVADTY